MNFELLHGTLEVSENPGLETIDPRFSDIATLAMEGRYEEAAAQSEAILEEQIYDIRIIGYALYGHFLDQGVGAMADINQCLASLLRDNLEALGPAKNREKHIQTILNWLMKQLLKKLQYEEEKKSSLYEGWISELTSDDVQEGLEAADELRRALGPVLEDGAGPVLDGLMKVNDWLTAFQRLVYKEPEPEIEPDEEPDEYEEDEEEETPPETKKGTVYPSAPLADNDMSGLEGSYHLKLLLKKLEAFDRLISEGKYPSAALVADDINNIIANFDPKIYFPKLFARFSLLLAANINELLGFQEHKGTAEWQALEELYKVDLDSFVNFDAQAVSLGAPGGSESYDAPERNESGSEDEDESGPREEEPYEEDDDEDDDW